MVTAQATPARSGPWTQDAAPPQRAYLRLTRQAETPVRLRAGQLFWIGRLPSCELVVEQPGVSRCHAVVYKRNSGWYVRDAGSTNGTFVNLVPVTGAVRLRYADDIRIGATVTLRFELLPPQASTWHRWMLQDSWRLPSAPPAVSARRRIRILVPPDPSAGATLGRSQQDTCVAQERITSPPTVGSDLAKRGSAQR
jgi:pSer/pThr/pTyr-binding forkhead associated (FHA) protein